MSRKTRLAREIELIEKALKRNRARLNEIAKAWSEAGAPCCSSCFSQEYSELADKVDRTEPWLERLQAKLEKLK